MKRFGTKICMAACMALVLAILPINHFKVQADEIIATVEGTILTGTTAELLKLSTKSGNMEIKMDNGTDTSAYKTLVPSKKIKVAVSRNKDGTLRAAQITSAEQTDAVTLDLSTKTTVTGTLGEKTTGQILYLSTAQGEMQIKLDTATCLCDCAVLVAGKTYNIVCARGSDAFMHAISVADPTAAGAAGTGTTTAGTGTAGTGTTAASNMATMSVSGTVSDRTKENILYLHTSGGEMQFAIDSNADTGKGFVHTPGNRLTVAYYHGSDGYLHAVGIVGIKDGDAAPSIDTSNTATVSGTVGSNSTENILYLKTSAGEMQLKLDAVSSLNNCKVLISGKKITVTCARGSDAYMHAISISG